MRTPKFVASLTRFGDSYPGTLLLMGTTFMLMIFAVGPLISAALAADTADPIPTKRVTWNGDMQVLASSTQASLAETWTILASYVRTPTSKMPLPQVSVVTETINTRCALDTQGTPPFFDPKRSLMSFCRQGGNAYLSAPLASAYEQKFGVGSLIGYLVEHLLRTKNPTAGNIQNFAVCAAGAWLGYLNYWNFLDSALHDKIQSHFLGVQSEVFSAGYQNRSLKPCLAM